MLYNFHGDSDIEASFNFGPRQVMDISANEPNRRGFFSGDNQGFFRNISTDNLMSQSSHSVAMNASTTTYIEYINAAILGKEIFKDRPQEGLGRGRGRIQTFRDGIVGRLNTAADGL